MTTLFTCPTGIIPYILSTYTLNALAKMHSFFNCGLKIFKFKINLFSKPLLFHKFDIVMK